jgi:hypothetical protein
LSLSGACPIWRGFLSDIDCRWNVLSQAADDRTIEEQQRPNLPSRYGSTPMYLTDQNKHLNDVEIDVDEEVVSTLIDHGQFFNRKSCKVRHCILLNRNVTNIVSSFWSFIYPRSFDCN